MNNAFVIESISLKSDVRVDNTLHLQKGEGRLVKILDAIQGVKRSKEWSTLKEEVFDHLTDSLNKELSIEAKKEIPDTLKLNRLAGQLKWAEKYSDLKKMEDSFRLELTNIRIQLYGKKE